MKPFSDANSPESVVNRVMDLFQAGGGREYHGERVSQLEHALQTAEQAVAEGGSDEEIIAALLHDIGHIWPEADSLVTDVGVVEHDRIGAEVLLRLGFSEAVAQTVAGHVAAKRYLVANDADYGATLSPASVESLRLQGGPMSAEESERFAAAPWHRGSVRVRVWDDRAKTPGTPTAPLESYRDILLNHLRQQQGVGL